jgi:hypothetical protein
MDANTLGSRIQDVLDKCQGPPSEELLSELIHGTLTVVRAMYGANSSQEVVWRASLERIRIEHQNSDPIVLNRSIAATRGVLQALLQEIDSGFIGSLRTAVTSEILGSFIKLAHGVLDEFGENGKDVAAVLTAAAFRDTIRYLANKNGLEERDELSEILEELREEGILRNTQAGNTQSYLSFCNKALRAEWTEVDMCAVKNTLAFTEALLAKHFSER